MSHTKSNITIVCYDITSNRLRSKIDKCMKDFGIRIQFSIFLCRLDSEGVKRCRSALLDVVRKFSGESNPEDSLIIFERLSPNSVDCVMGAKIANIAPTFLVL